MSNSKKRSRGIFRFVNLFDIIVILIIVALLLVLYFGKSKTVSVSDSQSSTVIYTVELSPMVNNTAELISVGDELVDKLKKYDLGVVKEVTVDVAKKQVEDYVNGGLANSDMQTKQGAIVTIESTCTQTDTDITVGGGYVIKVGTAVNIKGPGYNGSGYILSIERGEDQ